MAKPTKKKREIKWHVATMPAYTAFAVAESGRVRAMVWRGGPTEPWAWTVAYHLGTAVSTAMGTEQDEDSALRAAEREMALI